MSVREHLRSNVVGYVALFFVFTGGAYALQGKNSVNSGDIKKGQVKKSDLAANSVDSSKVVDNTLTGADIDEESLAIPAQAASGPAGGDLSGTYPNPQIAADAVGGAEVTDGSLLTADIDESTLFNDNSLAANDLANDSVASGEIAADAVGASEVANNSIGVNEPSINANDEIIDGSVDSEDVATNSLTSADIDETGLDVARVDGHDIVVAHAHVAASGSTSLLNADPVFLDVACSAGGEATVQLSNVSGANSALASYIDKGATDPTFASIPNAGAGVAESASANDLWVWHVAEVTASGSATIVIGFDESGADCDFYARAIVG